MLDNNYALMAEHFYLLDPRANVLIQAHPKQVMLASAVGKNFFVLQSSLQLVREGLYGPARTLLRHVLEALVIAKYTSLSEEYSAYNRWSDGKSLSFSRLLDKVGSPDMNEIKILWDILCKSSHATNVSQQIVLEWQECKKDIHITLLFIRALLECQYHLLNSHLLTDSMKRFELENGDSKKVKELRATNRALFKNSRKFMGKKASQITREYCASWKLSR
jgi:hypothetical protein